MHSEGFTFIVAHAISSLAREGFTHRGPAAAEPLAEGASVRASMTRD